MAATVVERAWRESAPEQVEADLAALWRELAGHGQVARAVMSNLVVFRLHERRARARNAPGEIDESAHDLPLDEVCARHPSRMIVIEHDRGEHTAQAPIGAGVGIMVFGPAGARYAVERVVLRSACADASLPSVIRRFVRGDLPTSVWWTEDISRVPPLPALTTMARQLVYDSRCWRDVRAGLRAIAPLVAEGRVDLADVNWRRLLPIRTALAHAAASITGRVQAKDVQVAHRPGEGALAWLASGWLAARLRWPAGERPVVAESRDRDQILAITVGAGETAISATLDGRRAIAHLLNRAPLVVAAPRTSDADAVAAELRTLSFETALHDALLALTT
jgi:glucose-6-phosphate dehydrogenase assembly protein OpcA